MAFPPAHMLIGAGFAEVACAGMRNPPPRWLAWSIGAVLAAGPDADIIVGILRGRGGADHGTFSHSLTAVTVIALMGYVAGGGRWALIGGLTYGSHLLVDLLDDSGPTNLMLGWPFTGTRPYSIAKLFPKVPVEGDGIVDTALNVLRPHALLNLLLQTLLAAVIFAALLWIASAIRRWRASPAGTNVGGVAQP
ncbi:MAG TPA: metal-dependent hydrolase [Longimicrobium sp.]|nr:metal-dependent hydrolase [Longimicrobium sp.]